MYRDSPQALNKKEGSRISYSDRYDYPHTGIILTQVRHDRHDQPEEVHFIVQNTDKRSRGRVFEVSPEQIHTYESKKS